jgi:hypothetical protein
MTNPPQDVIIFPKLATQTAPPPSTNSIIDQADRRLDYLSLLYLSQNWE